MKSNSLVEFWPALLEKAYAKAKGTYQLLNSWLPIDACIELTGGCPERVKRISSLLSGDKRQVDRLFMDILRANQNGNIVVVSFVHADSLPELNEEARQLGLEPRYVYRVTQVTRPSLPIYPYAIKNQRKARNAPSRGHFVPKPLVGGFGCLELVRYGIGELA